MGKLIYSGGPTELAARIQLRETFNKVLLIAVAIIVSLFICAAIVEWIRSAYAPFHGFANYKWIPRLQTFLYLMAMFNILFVRYVVMRIHIAPGSNDFETIVKKLSNADIASMVICELPCFYGLALFLLTGDVIDFYLLFGLSIVYYMIYFPRYKNWFSLVEQMADKELNYISS